MKSAVKKQEMRIFNQQKRRQEQIGDFFWKNYKLLIMKLLRKTTRYKGVPNNQI